MKHSIQKLLCKAILSGDYLLNLNDKNAPLCEILPDGRHRFSPAGVLCDLAPKEVADWEPWDGMFLCDGCWRTTADGVDKWAALDWAITPPINGHRTLSATIKAIEEL